MILDKSGLHIFERGKAICVKGLSRVKNNEQYTGFTKKIEEKIRDLLQKGVKIGHRKRINNMLKAHQRKDGTSDNFRVEFQSLYSIFKMAEYIGEKIGYAQVMIEPKLNAVIVTDISVRETLVITCK